MRDISRHLVKVRQKKVLHINRHSCVIKAARHLKLHKKYDAVLISERVSAQASLSDAEDLSALLVQISVVIREKGVSRERVRELLEERYGVRSQQRLKTEQLRDWLEFVRNFGRSIAGFAVGEA